MKLLSIERRIINFNIHLYEYVQFYDSYFFTNRFIYWHNMIKNNKAKDILGGIDEDDEKFYLLHSGVIFR